MKRTRLLLGLLVLALPAGPVDASSRGHIEPFPTPPPRLRTAGGVPPVQPPPFFEENAGQSPGEVQVIGRGGGVSAFLVGGGVVLADAQGRGASTMLLAGSDPAARWRAESPTGGRSSYFLGTAPSRWKRGLPQFSRAVLRGAWQGIDAEFRGEGDLLAYGFHLAPLTDPSRIRLSLEGADAVAVDGAGDLVVSVPGGRFRHTRPVAWQEVKGGRIPVEARFAMHGMREAGIRLGRHDPSLATLIDPRIEFSSYLGGTGNDSGYDNGVPDSIYASSHLLASDTSGNLYLTGQTLSTDFPLKGAYQGSLSGTQDVFVTKVDPVAHKLIYSTYIGGPGDDRAFGIAVDPSGEACVTGIPHSSGFPITAGAFQTVMANLNDVFVLKLAADGASLVFSSYLGGGNTDQPDAIACDASGNVVVTGITASGSGGSAAFPVKNPIQGALAGSVDAYVTKFQADGTALIFSTYYGGVGADLGVGLSLDSAGAVYVTGYTLSADFPTVAPLQAAIAGAYDAFVLKLNASGSAVSYATYLGGTLDDAVVDVAVDSTGAAYLAGRTKSSNFPVTTGVLQGTLAGKMDGFVAKVNPSGSALAWSTYLGGTDDDRVFGIALGAGGAVLLSGETRSSNFPSVGAFQGTKNALQDGFVAKLNATGTALGYSSFIGGSGNDYLRGMAYLGNARTCIAGWTDSGDWTVSGAFQASKAGGTDMIVAVVTATPVAPSGLTPTVQSSSRIDLSWLDNSNDETGFEIERMAGTGAWISVTKTAPNAASYQDGNTIGSTLYTYRVRAVNDDGVSGWSNEAMGTTPPGPPGAPLAPGAVLLTENSPTQVLVEWEDRSDSEDFFQVNRRQGTGTYATLATPTAGATSYSDNGVLPDRTYSYRVRAGNVGGLSLASDEASITVAATLEPVLAKGLVKDSPKSGRDLVKISGTLSLLEGALSTGLDPMAYSLRLQLGGWDGTTLMAVPAGDPGWKLRRGKWTWKSPKGAFTKAIVKLDPATGIFSVAVSRLTLPSAPANPFLFSLGAGSDGGSTSADWTAKRAGTWKYP